MRKKYESGFQDGHTAYFPKDATGLLLPLDARTRPEVARFNDCMQRKVASYLATAVPGRVMVVLGAQRALNTPQGMMLTSIGMTADQAEEFALWLQAAAAELRAQTKPTSEPT